MADIVRQERYISIYVSSIPSVKSGKNTWNIRCPICGDSKRNRFKKRGYIFWDRKNLCYRFFCHNCGSSRTFEGLLRETSPELYKEYKREGFLEQVRPSPDPEQFIPKHHFPKKQEQGLIVPVSELSSGHPARVYLEGRCVPEERLSRVGWTERFRELVDVTFPQKYRLDRIPDSGILFELHDPGDLHFTGYQIRSIDPDVPKDRRFVICAEDGNKGFFGINHLEKGKQVFVVEGCTDSLFLPNCVAVLNAGIWRAGIENAVYFSDQEKRNHEVCREISKCVAKGYRTVLLPEQYTNMDVNDIVKGYGLTEEQLVDLFLKNCYSGIRAKMMFSRWRG